MNSKNEKKKKIKHYRPVEIPAIVIFNQIKLSIHSLIDNVNGSPSEIKKEHLPLIFLRKLGQINKRCCWIFNQHNRQIHMSIC